MRKEYDNARGNYRMNRGRRGALIRLLIAAVCFVAVFAASLSIFNFSSQIPIAFAGQRVTTPADNKSPTNDTKSGTAFATTMSPRGSLQTAMDRIKDNNDSVTGLTVTHDYSNYKPEETDYFFRRDDSEAETFVETGDEGAWTFGYTDAAANQSMSIAINVELPTLFAAIANQGGTVNLSYSFGTVTGYVLKGTWPAGDGTFYYGVKSAASPTIPDLKDTTGGGTLTGFGDGTTTKTGTHSGNADVTKSEGHKYAVLSFGINITTRIGDTVRYATFSGLSLTITVTACTTTQLKKAVEEVVANGDDYGNPVWAEDYKMDAGASKESVDYLRTDATSEDAGTNNKLPWEVWIDDKANLGSYSYDSNIDMLSVTTGAMSVDKTYTIRSWQRTSLGNVPGVSNTPYYRKATLSAVDSFNFTGVQNVDFSVSANKKYFGLYGHSWSSGNSLDTIGWSDESSKYASGLKEVIIGAKTIDIPTADNGKSSMTPFTQSAEDDAPVVGYAQITRKTLGDITIEIYFIANCNVRVNVKDKSGNQIMGLRQYNITGIYPSRDLTGVSISSSEPTVLGDSDDIEWGRSNRMTGLSLTASNTAEESGTVPPLIWYLIVEKGTIPGTYPQIAPTSQPYTTWDAFNNDTTIFPTGFAQRPMVIDRHQTLGNPFDYYYDTGTYTYATGLSGAGNSRDLNTRTGSGYYRFTFYLFDMAGNALTNIKRLYSKADYNAPNFTTKLIYGDQTRQENDGWITNISEDGKLQIKLTLEDFSMSGNTLVYYVGNAYTLTYGAWEEVPRKAHVLTFTSSGFRSLTDGYAGDNLTYDAKSSNTRFTARGVKSDWNTTYNETNYDFNLEIVLDKTAKTITITITDNDGNAPVNLAWYTDFIILTGTYVDDGVLAGFAADPDAYLDSYPLNAKATNNWTDASGDTSADNIEILVDREAPHTESDNFTFDLEGAEDQTQEVYLYANEKELDRITDYLSLASAYGRSWYTAGEYVATSAELPDLLVQGTPAIFKQDIKFMYGVKVFKSLKDITDWLSANKISELYKTYGSLEEDDSGVFDALVTTMYDSDPEKTNVKKYDLELSLIEHEDGTSAGLRLIYAWAVDEAGNCSELVVKFLLADWYEYTLSASNDSSELLSREKGEINISNETAYRGEQITLDLSLESGSGGYYVLYRLLMGEKVLLENLYGKLKSNGFALGKDTSENFDKLISGYTKDFVSEEAVSITLILDDELNIGPMEAEINFGMMYRKVVSTSMEAEQIMTYSAKPVSPQITITYLESSNDEALESDIRKAIVMVYRQDDNVLYVKKGTDGNIRTGYTTDPAEAETDEKGSYKFFVPGTPGDYVVYYYIPTDNEAFVFDNVAFEEDGSQSDVGHTAKISVIKATVYLVPDSKTVEYGFEISLTYVLSTTQDGYNPLAQELIDGEGGLSGGIALNGVAGSVNSKYTTLVGVGTYRIVVGEALKLGEYFDVQFVENVTCTIRPLDATIVPIAATKTFGDKDPDFSFGIDPNQFAELVAREGCLFKDINGVVNNIFNNDISEKYGTSSTKDVGGVTYTVFTVGADIDRAEGETVGSYDFTLSTQKIAKSGNFNVTMTQPDENQAFTITRRTVKIAIVSSQSLPAGAQFTPQNSLLKARIVDNSDAGIALVSEEVNGILAIEDILQFLGDFTKMEPVPEGFSEVRLYAVDIQEALNNNENVLIVLDTEANGDKFIVRFADATAIVISLKNPMLSWIFGANKWEENSIVYSAADFDVVGEGSERVNGATWTISIDGQEFDKYLGVGTYTVKLADIKLTDESGEDIVGVFAIAADIALSVLPAKVVIAPTAENTHKTYGEPDSAYGIGFKITSINDTPIAEGGAYADIPYADILSAISNGAFVRATFAGGLFSANAAQYDDATGEDGFVLGTAGDRRAYYAYTRQGTFTISNTNFTVEAKIDDNERLYIDKKDIDIDIQHFLGISKSYDGTNLVTYAPPAPYDLAQFALANDDISLNFTAVYSGVGAAKSPVDVSIIFTDISITGLKAHNYRIASVINGNALAEGNKILLGEDEQSEKVIITDELLATLSIIINYIDNSATEDFKHIQIIAGVLGITSADITIAKTYDGTTQLKIEDISIIDRGGFANARPLIAVLSSAELQNSTRFSGADVGTNYTIDTFTIRFNIPGANDYTIANKDESGSYEGFDDENVIITVDSESITLTVNNKAASIVQRQIVGGSFATISAVTRPYNALTGVTVNATFFDGALGAGHTTAADIGLHLLANSVNKNVGTWDIEISDTSYVENSNYRLVLDDIKKSWTGIDAGEKAVKAQITKARLIPNIEFDEHVYNGEVDLVLDTDFKHGVNFSSKPLATESYNSYESMGKELAKMSINAFNFTLCENGKETPNVKLDEQGNELARNILVKRLAISVAEEDEDILKNYVVAGVRYIDGEYVPITEDIENGQVITDYEIENAIVVTKAALPIQDTNVIIEDKVYNGDKEASIIINLPEQMPNKDKPYLQITATGMYRNSHVDSKVTVTLSDPQLLLTAAGEFEKMGYLLDNYRIVSNTSYFYGAIVPRPVAVTVEFGSKVYDGNRSIKNVNATYTLDGILPGEEKAYNVQTSGGAYFDDKNVNVDADGNVTLKDGAAFNPTLKNLNGGKVDYQLGVMGTKYDKDRTVLAIRLNEGSKWLYLREATQYISNHISSMKDETVTDKIEGVDAYIYALDTASKFILESEYETQKESIKDGEILGYVMDGDTGYYALADGCEAGSAVEALGTMTYLRGQGTITKRSVYIAANAIKKTDGTKAFEKQYDGTVKFFGKIEIVEKNGKPTDAADCYFEQGNISGLIAGDELKVEALEAEFDAANTTATGVMFKATKFAGKDMNNYEMSATSNSAKLAAKIIKRDITALLEDNTMYYGDLASDVAAKITYSLGEGEDNNLIWLDNAFYMSFDAYLTYINFSRETDAEYIKQLAENTYDAERESEDGEILRFVVKKGAEGEFIRLGGDVIALPSAKAVFGTVGLPSAGQIATSYTLNGGQATNFNFKFAYTGEKTSQLKVLPKDVYVSALNINHVAEYGNAGALPESRKNIAFYDANMRAYGFASGESYQTVFVRDGVDYGPRLVWYMYKADGTGIDDPIRTNVNELQISAQLGGYIYVAAYEEPAEWSYKDNITNYNVHVVDSAHPVKFVAKQVEGSDGVYQYYLVYGDEAETIEVLTTTLTITEPTITGVTLAEPGTSFPYDGSEHQDRFVTGTLASDSISLIRNRDAADNNGNVLRNVDAGHYEGYIFVKREVKWDERASQSVQVTWTSETPVSFDVTKIDPVFSASDDAKMYDGKEYIYRYNDNNSKVNGVTDIPMNGADVSFDKLIAGTYYAAYGRDADGNVVYLLKEKNPETGADVYYYLDARGNRVDFGGTVTVFKPIDAGTYRVTIALNENFTKARANYNAISFYAYVTIKPAEVTVSGLALKGDKNARAVEGQSNSKTKYFTGKYDADAEYEFDYEVSVSVENMAAGTAPSKENTSIVWDTPVTAAGRYTFRVAITGDGLNAENYSFVGADGVLELTASSFAEEEPGSPATKGNAMRVIDSEGNETEGVLANRLVVRTLKSTGGTGSDSDFWNKVSAYMPAIGSTAKLAGIVQVQLFLGETQVGLNGSKVELTLSIPETVDKQLKDVVIYQKNVNGGLDRIDDYQLTDGKIIYTTEYLGEVVFVDISVVTLPSWISWAIGIGAGAMALFVIWVVVAFAIRKSKLKKLA